MMHDQESLDRWIAKRRRVELPRDFAERVLVRIDREPTVSPARRLVDASWLHIAACIAASILFALRLGCVYSIFIPL